MAIERQRTYLKGNFEPSENEAVFKFSPLGLTSWKFSEKDNQDEPSSET